MELQKERPVLLLARKKIKVSYAQLQKELGSELDYRGGLWQFGQVCLKS